MVNTHRPAESNAAVASWKALTSSGLPSVAVGAVFYWPLAVPAGAVAVFLGAVLLVWQALGRTVFAGPAGARPAAPVQRP